MKKLLTMIGVAAAVAVGTALDAIATELVTNGGFEDYTGAIPSSHYISTSASLYANGWSGAYGLSEAGSAYFDSSVSPFEGSVSVHFNGSKEIYQSVDFPEDGLYEISFAYAPRNKANYAGGRVNAWIDGVKVGYADCDALTTRFRRCRMRVQVVAGTHTFMLSHTLDHPVNKNNTPCSTVDDVSIVKVDDGDLVANGGFEDCVGTFSGIEAGFSDSIKVDAWKYEGGTGLATTNSNYLKNKTGSPYEGNVSLYFNGAHSVSQTVFVAEAGDYDISFVYAPRHTSYYYNGRIRVVIDGEEVGDYANCDKLTSTFRRYLLRTPISEGLHVLQLKHTTENPADSSHTPCSVVDAVSIKAADDLLLNGNFDGGNVVANSGGYSGSTADGYSNPGWTVSGNAGLAKPGYPGTAWVSSQLDGTGVYSMFIQTANYSYGGTTRTTDAASIQQTFDVTKPGVYELRFSYAARPYNNYKGGQIFARIYKGEGLEGELMWERFVIANSLTSFDEFVGNVKLYDPGKYTLQFYAPQPEYSTTAENERDSVIDNVSLRFHHKIMGFIISFY